MICNIRALIILADCGFNIEDHVAYINGTKTKDNDAWENNDITFVSYAFCVGA